MTVAAIVELHESLKDESFADLRDALARIAPDPVCVARGRDVFNTPDWFLPAVVAISLAGQGVLSGFLEELGADAARGLKSSLIDAFRKAKSKMIKWRRGSDNEQLLDELRAAEREDREPNTAIGGRPAAPLSIELQIAESVHLPAGVAKPEITMRVVFPDDVTEEQFARALEAMNAVVSQATDVARERMEVDRKVAGLITNDPVAAITLLSSEHSMQLPRELVYVYRPIDQQWVDAHVEVRRQAREQIERRQKRRKRRK